jgi:hypothetical protein
MIVVWSPKLAVMLAVPPIETIPKRNIGIVATNSMLIMSLKKIGICILISFRFAVSLS